MPIFDNILKFQESEDLGLLNFNKIGILCLKYAVVGYKR